MTGDKQCIPIRSWNQCTDSLDEYIRIGKNWLFDLDAPFGRVQQSVDPASALHCIPQFNNSCLFIGLAGSCSCDVVDVYCSIHDFNWCSTLVVLSTQYSAFPTLQKLRTSYAIDPTPWWIKSKNWFIYANHIAWKYYFPNWNALVSSNAGVA